MPEITSPNRTMKEWIGAWEHWFALSHRFIQKAWNTTSNYPSPLPTWHPASFATPHFITRVNLATTEPCAWPCSCPSQELSVQAPRTLARPRALCHWPSALGGRTGVRNPSPVNTTTKEVLQIPLCSSTFITKFHIASFFLMLVFHTFIRIFYEISAILSWERQALQFQSILLVIFASAGKKKCFFNGIWLFAFHYE